MGEKEIVFLVKEDAEGGYTARASSHAIFTQGETWEELREMVREAVRTHFAKGELPALIRLHLEREEVFAP